ncbi:hypothetical protein [Clostridium paridis]|uniref:Uncharacterized protein n=1 Tax=Clostridium paridis TaxID=2803863 RepID=A0A937FIX1_9CLOT|nr:hypothetical protein [Clostridium paridis]MBL4933197.1 hypothetical protein [Clostridium paridis]
MRDKTCIILESCRLLLNDEKDKELLKDRYIKRWYEVAKSFRASFVIADVLD